MSTQLPAITRRRALGAGLALLSAGPLAACGASSTTGQSTTPTQAAQPAAKTATPATLRYVASFQPSEQPTFAGGLSQLVETFNAKGTPIQIEKNTPTGNRNQAVLAMLAAGDAPDLFHALPRDYHPFANAGALLELDSYMKTDRKVAADVLPVILEYWAREGKHYAMPNNWSPQAIYFNKSLFAKHGLKTPDQHEKEGTWTFDTYLDLARKLTGGTGEQKVWGAPWRGNALDHQLSFIWSFGGDMWDKEMKNTVLDRPQAIEAIQFQADLTARHGVSPTDDELKPYTWPGIGGTLANERGGIEILTTDLVGLLVNSTFEKGMAPIPKGKAGRVVRANPIGIHIMKATKHADAAWEYVAFQSGSEGAKIMMDRHLTVPWLKSLLGTAEHAKLLLPWESAATYAESSNKVRLTPYPPTFSDITSLYAKSYGEVRAGTKTAQQMITEIKPQIDEFLRK